MLLSIRSAHSARIIKERRDASTALFDPAGQMIMQAQHIPVHLGAMPAAVAAVVNEDHRPLLPAGYQRSVQRRTTPPTSPSSPRSSSGRTSATPAPCSVRRQPGAPRRRRGPTPGSMPADSTTRPTRRAVIEPRPLDDEAITAVTALMRQPEQRRADLRAQVAANRIGGRRLAELADRVGPDRLQTAFGAVLRAERRAARASPRFPTGSTKRATRRRPTATSS